MAEILNNNYSFDYVGNINNITSSTPQSKNDMGGSYNFSYTYDHLNRLTNSSGSFNIIEEGPIKEGGPTTITYSSSPYAVSNSEYLLNLQYNGSSGILQKDQKHLQDQHPNAENTYENIYEYINGTHMPRSIGDGSTGIINYFEYDYN